jgi:S1-C subfamily serine protease
MGLTVHPLDGELAQQLGYARQTRGLLVLKIDPQSRLSNELQVYDVLEAVGRQPVSTVDDLYKVLAEATRSTSVPLHIRRKSPGGVNTHVVVWQR